MESAIERSYREGFWVGTFWGVSILSVLIVMLR
jgi:hypothetical protein